jgi:carboxypeptidase PM20D1
MALMEAAESLLASGFQPPCDVYFAFGYDEEVGGQLGARRLAARLVERGVRLDYAIDEGGMISTGAFPGLALPLATIGVAEKGYMSLTLEVKVEGGHSSMPPRQTAIGMLAAAIARLEADSFPASLDETERALLREAGSHLTFGERMVFGNLWLTAPLVEHALSAKPATDATLRTTTAATIVHAGVKDNVLPSEARAVVNFRIRPGETSASVRARVAQVIDDPRVKVSNDEQWTGEPTNPAPVEDPAYRRIAAVLRSVHAESELVVAPYVVNGGTDLRQYEALTPKLYRIGALKLPIAELSRVHGSNERVERVEYARMIRFYQAMLAAPGVG